MSERGSPPSRDEARPTWRGVEAILRDYPGFFFFFFFKKRADRRGSEPTGGEARVGTLRRPVKCPFRVHSVQLVAIKGKFVRELQPNSHFCTEKTAWPGENRHRRIKIAAVELENRGYQG